MLGPLSEVLFLIACLHATLFLVYFVLSSVMGRKNMSDRWVFCIQSLCTVFMAVYWISRYMAVDDGSKFAEMRMRSGIVDGALSSSTHDGTGVVLWVSSMDGLTGAGLFVCAVEKALRLTESGARVFVEVYVDRDEVKNRGLLEGLLWSVSAPGGERRVRVEVYHMYEYEMYAEALACVYRFSACYVVSPNAIAYPSYLESAEGSPRGDSGDRKLGHGLHRVWEARLLEGFEEVDVAEGAVGIALQGDRDVVHHYAALVEYLQSPEEGVVSAMELLGRVGNRTQYYQRISGHFFSGKC